MRTPPVSTISGRSSTPIWPRRTTSEGSSAQALAAGERALAFFESRGNLWWACRTLWHLVVASMAVGEWDRALDYCRRALAHAEAMDDRRLRVRTLSLTGSVYIQRGDPATGLGWCDRALALSPMPFDARVIQAIRGYGLARLGDLPSGIAALQDAVAWFSRARLRYSATMTALRLIEAYLEAGRLDEATALLADVLRDTSAAGYRHAEGIAHRLLGEATMASNPEAAASDLDTARRLLEETGAQNELAKTLVASSTSAGPPETGPERGSCWSARWPSSNCWERSASRSECGRCSRGRGRSRA